MAAAFFKVMHGGELLLLLVQFLNAVPLPPFALLALLLPLVVELVAPMTILFREEKKKGFVTLRKAFSVTSCTPSHFCIDMLRSREWRMLREMRTASAISFS